VSWQFAFASVVGTSHVAIGKACDDAACCDVLVSPRGDEILVAIASDGAGSAVLSSFGAKLTTQVMFDSIRSWIEQGGSVRDLVKETVFDWLDCVRDQICHLAKNDDREPRDYSATLLFAIIGPNAGAVGQIGDGAVVSSENGTDWEAVFWPQHGPYANQTYFVTDERGPRTAGVKDCRSAYKRFGSVYSWTRASLVGFRAGARASASVQEDAGAFVGLAR
jgi:hypothetical protein